MFWISGAKLQLLVVVLKSRCCSDQLTQYLSKYTIVYALWDEEEQGLVGAYYYAQQASVSGDSILGVINMDMIAWDSNSDHIADVHTRPIGSSI